MKIGNATIKEWIEFIDNQLQDKRTNPWLKRIFKIYSNGGKSSVIEEVNYVLEAFKDALVKLRTLTNAYKEIE